MTNVHMKSIFDSVFTDFGQPHLFGVGKVRQDADNAACGGCFAGIGHDQKLHDTVVDVFGARLNQVHIATTHTFPNVDQRLAIGRMVNGTGAQSHVQTVGNFP